MPVYFESGNQLPLLSLGGVISQAGQGRNITSNSVTITGPTQLAPANPKRIAAVVQNIGDPALPGCTVGVYFGSLNVIPVTLGVMGTIQIDTNLPWIGEIDVVANAGAPVCTIMEINIT